MLIMAHSDVVPTEGQPWKTNPHTPTELGDYLYGRGTYDDLSYAAVVAELLIDIKNSGTVLDRDIIFAFTADEERGSVNGMIDVIAHYPNLIKDAQFALNEGASVVTDELGRPLLVAVSNAEKNYMDFKIVVDNIPGGPSWRPLPRNAITLLSRAAVRIAQVEFPVLISPLAREYFRLSASSRSEPMRGAMLAIANSTGQPPLDVLPVIARDPILNGSIRTTCVATQFTAGVAPNVLATKAELNVNCRILPGTSVGTIRTTLTNALRQDPELSALLEVSAKSSKPFMKIVDGDTFGQESPISPMEHPVFEAVNAVSAEMLDGTMVIPQLNTGASDSRLTRIMGIPTYGIGPMFAMWDDLGRVHNANERISLKHFQNAIQFYYSLLSKLAGNGRMPSSVMSHSLKKGRDKDIGKAIEALENHPLCAD